MTKSRHQFAKRQKELDKKRKKEEKRLRKLEKNSAVVKDEPEDSSDVVNPDDNSDRLN